MFPIKHLHPAYIVPHTKYDCASWNSREKSLLEIYESDLINPNFHKNNKEDFDKLEDKIQVLSLLVKFKYARHCGDREKQNEILTKLQKVFENKPGFYACLALVKNSSRFFKVALPRTFKGCILEVIENGNMLDFIQLKEELTMEEFNFIKKIAPSQFKTTELLSTKTLEKLKIYESDFTNPDFHKSNKEVFDKLKNKIKVLSLLVKLKYALDCGRRENKKEILNKLKKIFDNKYELYACVNLVKYSSNFFKVALPHSFKGCILEVVENKNKFDFIQLKEKLTVDEFNFIKKISPSQFEAAELLVAKTLEDGDKKYLYKGLFNRLNPPDKKRMEEIFFEDADVNQADEKGRTFLWTSVENKQNRAVELLITRFDVDVNKPDNERRTPLFVAIEIKNEPAIKLLLSHYAIDINKRDNKGRTPLQIAIEEGSTEIARLLLEHDYMDADKEIEENELLHLAIKRGYTDIVKLLISRQNTNPLKTNHNGKTPMQIAEENKRSEIIDLLKNRIEDYIKEDLDQGAKNQLATILPFIFATGNAESLKPYIFGRSLDLYQVYYPARRSLIEVIFYNPKIELLNLALQHGKIKLQKKRPREEGDPGRKLPATFIEFFLKKCNQRKKIATVILYLILTELKININERGDSGFSILYNFLVETTFLDDDFLEDFIKPILSHSKTDVNMQDRQGNTLLHILAAYGDRSKTKALKILLAHPNIDAAKQNQNGETPLSIATKNKCHKNVSLILEKLSEDQLVADRKLETKMLFEMHLNKSLCRTQGIDDASTENYHTNDTEDIFDIMDGYWCDDKPVYDLKVNDPVHELEVIIG